MNTATSPVVTLNAAPTPRVYAGFPRLSTRLPANAGGPNHHLYNNNGTWFIHYTLYPNPFTKERVRVSLKTSNVEEARSRRDQFFSQIPGGEALLRGMARASAA